MAVTQKIGPRTLADAPVYIGLKSRFGEMGDLRENK
jgi:hypothetical protein